MDVSPQISFADVPSLPGVEAALRPISTEDVLPVQAFLPPPAAGLVAVAAPNSMVLAQQFDQDILGDMGKLWNTFIESGQVWALIIGIVVGYLVRGLTAY